MSLIQIIVLAVTQGVTEFLPISSSGHLILGSWLFDWPDQGFLFDAAVHIGTLMAVLLYFRNEWIQLALGIKTNRFVVIDQEGANIRARTLFGLIVVAVIPLALGALLFRDFIGSNFRTPEAVGWMMIGTAIALVIGEMTGRNARRIGELKIPDALVIGIAQLLAIFPGVSRSGVTMVSGMALGMTRDGAARFSMLIAAPAVAGAGLLFAVDSLQGIQETDWLGAAIGGVVAMITAYFSIAGLIKLLRKRSFWPFIFYCGMVGGVVVIVRTIAF